MELQSVTSTYRRWAPVYDRTFGAVTSAGRRRAVEHINQRSGSVLEIGVGTGLSLVHYAPHLKISGMDFSDEMLEKARRRVSRRNLEHVVDLRQGDARELPYDDDSFDTVVAMYLVSVVPEPERVIAEMGRVCRPGGEVLIVNHFAREKGFLAKAEKALAPFADKIGWHSDFALDRILVEDDLDIIERSELPPFGMFTFLRMKKAG